MGQKEVTPNSVVRWSSAAVATEVSDEVVLMNLERNRCYGLDSTGSEIWRRLELPIPVSELVTQLVNRYDAPPGQIELDVLRTLGEFVSEGLIDVSAPNE